MQLGAYGKAGALKELRANLPVASVLVFGGTRVRTEGEGQGSKDCQNEQTENEDFHALTIGGSKIRANPSCTQGNKWSLYLPSGRKPALTKAYQQPV